VVNLPVIFWADIATPARFSFQIMGQVVAVTMSAEFHWSWGDGASLITTSAGAPYPSQAVNHTYLVPGRYRVVLTTTWSGLATVAGTPVQIVGQPIKADNQLDILIGQAPTRLTPTD